MSGYYIVNRLTPPEQAQEWFRVSALLHSCLRRHREVGAPGLHFRPCHLAVLQPDAVVGTRGQFPCPRNLILTGPCAFVKGPMRSARNRASTLPRPLQRCIRSTVSPSRSIPSLSQSLPCIAVEIHSILW